MSRTWTRWSPKWQAVLAGFPAGEVLGPVNQPYRQRELMIVAPDGNLLVFGQAIDA